MAAFNKYRERGAYHWDHLSRHPGRHHCFTAARYRLVRQAVKAAPGEVVVDVGCGDGALLSLLAQTGATCVGVEPEDVGRELARTKIAEAGLVVEVVASLGELPNAVADAVVLAEVIEHVPEPDLLLGEIAQILKPGGRLVVTTPIRITEQPRDKEHVHEYFPSELRNYLGQMFEVTAHRQAMPVLYVELYTAAPGFLRRLPLIRYAMNVQSVLTGRSILESNGRVPTHQLIVCCKQTRDRESLRRNDHGRRPGQGAAGNEQ